MLQSDVASNLDFNNYLRVIYDLSLNFLQSAIPEVALMGSWKKSAHNLWVNRLRRVSSLREFLQVLNVDFIHFFLLVV